LQWRRRRWGPTRPRGPPPRACRACARRLAASLVRESGRDRWHSDVTAGNRGGSASRTTQELSEVGRAVGRKALVGHADRRWCCVVGVLQHVAPVPQLPGLHVRRSRTCRVLAGRGQSCTSHDPRRTPRPPSCKAFRFPCSCPSSAGTCRLLARHTSCPGRRGSGAVATTSLLVSFRRGRVRTRGATSEGGEKERVADDGDDDAGSDHCGIHPSRIDGVEVQGDAHEDAHEVVAHP